MKSKMSVLDQFAAAALTGWVSHNEPIDDYVPAAMHCYAMADAMVAEAARREGGRGFRMGKLCMDCKHMGTDIYDDPCMSCVKSSDRHPNFEKEEV